MIILDSETQKPPLVTRAPSILSTATAESASTSSDGSPPSYRSRHSRHSIQPMYDDRPPSVSDVDPDVPVKPKRRLRLEQGWCWKGLLYVLVVYAVVSIAVAVPYFVTHHKNSSTAAPSYNRMDNDSTNTKSIVMAPPNIPSADGVVKACDQWSDTYAYGYPDPTEASRLTYSIPSNASNLWLRSMDRIQGLTSGQLSVILNPDEAQSAYLISVTVTYDQTNWSARNSTAICLMQSDQTSWGIGFYPATSKSWNLTLQYQITIYMPQIDDQTNTLSQFLVNLAGFSLSFQDLQGYVVFNNLDISGDSTHVDGILSANVISINTSRASIKGNYTSSESLTLQTSSGVIDTDITLASGIRENIPTNLTIQSTEGSISVRITLSGAQTSNTTSLVASDSPWFQTNVVGEDSSVTVILSHTDDLLSLELDLNVNTTFSRALVLLDERLQGSFALRSVNGSIIVTDIDATTSFSDGVLDGSFPTSTYYRRSLDIRSHSPSELYGVVRRDDGDQGSPESTGRVNVQVQNYLALIAFGFFQSGDPNSVMAEMGF